MDSDSVTALKKRHMSFPKFFIHKQILVGISIIIVILCFSFTNSFFGKYDINEATTSLFSGPSKDHWFGTDNIGRDLMSRVAVAGANSLLIAFFATGISCVFGTAIGLLAAYNARKLDSWLMGFVDMMLSIPAILLALTLVAIFGPSLETLIFSLSFIFVPHFARIVRGPALAIRELDFVSAAKLSRVPSWRIIIRHILPNTTTSILVQCANTAALCILVEATLSFLGLGVQPPDPSWGRLIFDGQRYMSQFPHLVLAPGLSLISASIGLSLIAEGLQQHLKR